MKPANWSGSCPKTGAAGQDQSASSQTAGVSSQLKLCVLAATRPPPHACAFSLSCIQLVLTEQLLWAEHCAQHWGQNRDQHQAWSQALLSLQLHGDTRPQTRESPLVQGYNGIKTWEPREVTCIQFYEKLEVVTSRPLSLKAGVETAATSVPGCLSMGSGQLSCPTPWEPFTSRRDLEDSEGPAIRW